MFKKIMLIIFTIFLIGCGDEKTKDEEVKTENIQPKVDLNKSFDLIFTNSPDILTLQKDGDNLKMSDNSKIIIFNFFTSWCEPCKAQIPHLIHLQTKYQDNVRFIGLLMDKNNEKSAQDFINTYNAENKYPINYEISSSDSNYYFSEVLGDVSGLPFTIIYDENGKRISSFLGGVYEEFIDMEIAKVLK